MQNLFRNRNDSFDLAFLLPNTFLELHEPCRHSKDGLTLLSHDRIFLFHPMMLA